MSSEKFTGRIVAQPVKKACNVNGYCDGSGKCIKHVHKPQERHHVDSFQEALEWIKRKWYEINGTCRDCYCSC